jgi:hypothetical protein
LGACKPGRQIHFNVCAEGVVAVCYWSNHYNTIRAPLQGDDPSPRRVSLTPVSCGRMAASRSRLELPMRLVEIGLFPGCPNENGCHDRHPDRPGGGCDWREPPPLAPPGRPRATAWGFFSCLSSSISPVAIRATMMAAPNMSAERFSPLGPLGIFVAKLVKAPQMAVGPLRVAIQKLGDRVCHFAIRTSGDDAGRRSWPELSNLPWTEPA